MIRVSASRLRTVNTSAYCLWSQPTKDNKSSPVVKYIKHLSWDTSFFHIVPRECMQHYERQSILPKNFKIEENNCESKGNVWFRKHGLFFFFFFFSPSAFNLSTGMILGLISSCALKVEPENWILSSSQIMQSKKSKNRQRSVVSSYFPIWEFIVLTRILLLGFLLTQSTKLERRDNVCHCCGLTNTLIPTSAPPFPFLCCTGGEILLGLI